VLHYKRIKKKIKSSKRAEIMTVNQRVSGSSPEGGAKASTEMLGLFYFF